MALLLRRRHAHRPASRTSTRWRRRWTASRRAPGRRRLSPLPGDLARICTRSRSGSSSGSRSRTCSTPSTCAPTSIPATLRDVLSLRMGRTVAGTIRGQVQGRAARADAGPFHASMSAPRPIGAPAVLCAIAHMQAAEGVWYPIGGTRAVAEALARLAAELGADVRGRRRRSTGLDDRGRRRDGRRRRPTASASRCDARDLQHGRDPHLSRAGRRRGRRGITRRKGFEPACSGVVLYLGLTDATSTSRHHDFVFSRDPEEEFDFIYRRGEPAPDPTCYLAAPSGDRPERRAARAARRCTCWCTRPTCGRTTTGRRCSPPTAGRSSTS